MGKLLHFPQPQARAENLAVNAGPCPIPPAAGSLRILPVAEPSLIERVISRLSEAEAQEEDPWMRDDFRQARLSVQYAGEGSPMPFVEASYKLYGAYPDLVWEKITALRKAHLGQEYSRIFDTAGNLIPQFLDIPDYDPSIPLKNSLQVQVSHKRKWPKGPLRRIVNVTRVWGDGRIRYHLKQLECGHTHTEFLDANPGKKRRRCHECR